MAESTWFRVTIRRKLAVSESGETTAHAGALTAWEAISAVLEEIPSRALTVSGWLPGDAAAGTARSVITIDWSAVPESVRRPRIPGRMTHLGRPADGLKSWADRRGGRAADGG